MTYHIFKISAFKQFTHLDSKDKYRDAKSSLKTLRTADDAEPGATFRMMFADSAHQAERLLKEKREARPMGEHD